MLMSGHGWPSGIRSGKGVEPDGQGQARPGSPGKGRSFTVGPSIGVAPILSTWALVSGRVHSRPVYLVATLAHLRETGYFVTHVTSVFQRVRNLLSSFDARHTRIIEHMHLAACVPCQYDCVDCAHDGMRNKFSGYHLNLDDLREFIRCTEESRYLVKLLDLTGPGEPLLWRNLKEGLRLLHKSPAIRKVRIVTNGSVSYTHLTLPTSDLV